MDDLLQQGITAYRAGKRDEARKFFVAAVKQNQNDERVWGWMYNVCDIDKERVHCLKQMLRIFRFAHNYGEFADCTSSRV